MHVRRYGRVHAEVTQSGLCRRSASGIEQYGQIDGHAVVLMPVRASVRTARWSLRPGLLRKEFALMRVVVEIVHRSFAKGLASHSRLLGVDIGPVCPRVRSALR